MCVCVMEEVSKGGIGGKKCSGLPDLQRPSGDPQSQEGLTFLLGVQVTRDVGFCARWKDGFQSLLKIDKEFLVLLQEEGREG